MNIKKAITKCIDQAITWRKEKLQSTVVMEYPQYVNPPHIMNELKRRR